MKLRILLAITIFTLFSKAYGQQFYVNTAFEYYGITINGTSYTWQRVPACVTSPFSIAMSGKFMYSAAIGQLYKSELINGTVGFCTQIGPINTPNSLTIDDKGFLYYVSGNQLYKYDPQTKVNTFLGSLPYSSAGDLTFYKGNLYMAATNDAIIQINIAKPSLSTVFMPVPATYGAIYGMVTAVVNNKIKVYALGIVNNSTTNLIELDLNTKTINGIVAVLPFVVYDAASPSETGNINQIKITNISIKQDCDAFDRATMQITCAADTNQYTYKLNNGISDQTGTFSGLAPGTYNINITSTSGDSKDTTAIIPDYTPPTHPVSFTVTNPSCGVISSVKLNPVQTGAYTVKYQNVSYPSDHVFTGLPAGGHHFTVYDQNGCVYDTLYAYINVSPCPNIVIDSTLITKECNALDLGRIRIYASPKNITLTYTLSNGANNTTGIFDDLAPGNYNLTITSPFANTKSTTVIVPDYTPASHPVTLTKTDPMCSVAGSVAFSNNTGKTYNIIYLGTAYPVNHTFTLAAGEHHFTVTDQNGCIADTLYARLVFHPCIDVIADSVKIQKECSSITHSNIQVYISPVNIPYTYTLNTGESNTTGAFNGLPPGQYTLTITSPLINQKQITITVPDPLLNKPVISYSITQPVCADPGSVSFNITGNDNTISYKISYGSGSYNNNSRIKGLFAGVHTFAILTSKGCIIDSVSIVLIKTGNCDPIVFPNTFTPNGDNINDVFRPKQTGSAKNYVLKIYDRNGTPVFTSNSFYIGWDGRYQGKDLPVGIYFFVATYDMDDGKPGLQKGSIALLR